MDVGTGNEAVQFHFYDSLNRIFGTLDTRMPKAYLTNRSLMLGENIIAYVIYRSLSKQISISPNCPCKVLYMRNAAFIAIYINSLVEKSSSPLVHISFSWRLYVLVHICALCI
jgi:hypothetical protein